MQLFARLLSFQMLLLCLVTLSISPPVFAEEEDESEDEPAPVALEEVVVTDSRSPSTNIDAAADVSVVDEEALKRPGRKSVLDAMTDVPGVKPNPRQEGATFNDLEVRGLTGNSTSGGNVLVLLDGIPQRRLSFGGPYLGALPFDSIVRAELAKGPTSSLYGRNALAGALQLFSDPGSDTFNIDARAGYEYPTNRFRASAKLAGPLGRRPISGESLSTFSFTGSFTTASGWQPRNDQIKGDAYLHAALNLTDRDRLTILAGFFVADEEYVAPVFVDENGDRLAGIDRDENLGVPGQNGLNIWEYRVAGRYERQWLPGLASRLTVSYWHGDSFWKVGRPDDQPASGTVIARSASDREFVEDHYFNELELIGWIDETDWMTVSLSAGASFEYLTYRMTVTQLTTQDAFNDTGGFSQGIPLDLATMKEPGHGSWLYGDTTRRDTFETDFGAFARARFSFIDRIFVTGGARWDTFERTQESPATGEEASMDDAAISPGAGLNAALVRMDDFGLNVYGNWGRGYSPVFRAVNNTQFAEVDPETSEGFDAGLKMLLAGRLLEATATFYQLERQDIVAMNPDTKLQENAGTWRIRGVETQITVRPVDPLAITARYAWRDPIILDYDADPSLEGNQIPGVARNAGAAGLSGAAPFGLGGGTELRYVGTFYGNDANSFELPDALLWDAWLVYRWKGLRVSAYARNLLDEEHFTAVFNGVKIGSAFEGPPRTFGLELAGRF